MEHPHRAPPLRRRGALSPAATATNPGLPAKHSHTGEGEHCTTPLAQVLGQADAQGQTDQFLGARGGVGSWPSMAPVSPWDDENS